MKRIGADPSAVLAVISFETGGTFSPKERNPKSGAVGLIQWTHVGAKSQGLEREQIAAMSAEQQLDLLAAWFERERPARLHRTLDYYLAVFAPDHIGKPMDAAVYSKPSNAYDQNAPLDSDNDGIITVADIAQHFLPVVEAARKRPRRHINADAWPHVLALVAGVGLIGAAVYFERNTKRRNPAAMGGGAVRSARAEKSMQWGILKTNLMDSKDRERKAKRERKHKLDDLREECADDKQQLQLRCKLDRDSARQKARDVTEQEESFRAEKRDHYQWTAGQTAKRTRGRRYSKAESDNLALQNIDPDLRDLFMETSSQWTRDVEPDQRAELFMEWVHESPEHVADWKRRTFEEDEPDYGAEYLAYGAA